MVIQSWKAGPHPEARCRGLDQSAMIWCIGTPFEIYLYGPTSKEVKINVKLDAEKVTSLSIQWKL